METQTQTVIYFTTMCVEMDVRLVFGRADLDSENRSSRETENELTQALVEVFHRKPREGFQKARVAESLHHAYQCIMLQRGVRVCARAHSCVCVCVCVSSDRQLPAQSRIGASSGQDLARLLRGPTRSART